MCFVTNSNILILYTCFPLTGNSALRIKRKRPRVDSALDNMAAKLIKHEVEAEKRYIEFEERRRKAEEESEERRQQREHKHELEMQGMFLQFLQQMSRPHFCGLHL